MSVLSLRSVSPSTWLTRAERCRRAAVSHSSLLRHLYCLRTALRQVDRNFRPYNEPWTEWTVASPVHRGRRVKEYCPCLLLWDDSGGCTNPDINRLALLYRVLMKFCSDVWRRLTNLLAAAYTSTCEQTAHRPYSQRHLCHSVHPRLRGSPQLTCTQTTNN